MTNEDKPDERTPRELDTRAGEARDTYTPSGMLPPITKVPGFAYRWVRVSARGQDDSPNMNARLREGWEPCKADEHPEYKQFLNKNGPSKFKGLIEHSGLLLCKIPEEKVKARRRYYAQQADAQIEAVDNNFMRENDKRMPLFKERRTTVSNRGDS